MRQCWLGQKLFVQSPAKLNLFLHIHGKRPDGFHELETLMVPIGIFDTLSFETEESTESRLRIVDAGARLDESAAEIASVSTGPDNLILRAVRAVQEYAGISRQVRITAWKRIPPASGMAGGSGNAAATLLGLNRFWNLGLSPAELFPLGASLGSDVNFFLGGGCAAVCRGRGERIEPLRIPNSMYFVVVRPFTGLSTPAVFRQWTAAGESANVEPLVAALRQGRSASAAKLLRNALQPPAEELNSEVAALKRCFDRLPVDGHLMTGSGTAYFGLCASRRLADRLSVFLRSQSLGRVFATQMLT
jgi:4-diphosphocytidyl-2-C-methyl-D-erythritol kinase